MLREILSVKYLLTSVVFLTGVLSFARSEASSCDNEVLKISSIQDPRVQREILLLNHLRTHRGSGEPAWMRQQMLDEANGLPVGLIPEKPKVQPFQPMNLEGVSARSLPAGKRTFLLLNLQNLAHLHRDALKELVQVAHGEKTLPSQTTCDILDANHLAASYEELLYLVRETVDRDTLSVPGISGR